MSSGRHAKVFQQFYYQLAKILPMDDPTFTALLFSSNLLPGNLKDSVSAKPTPKEKSIHFLDKAIKDKEENLEILFKVIDDSDFEAVKVLVKQMRTECEY